VDDLAAELDHPLERGREICDAEVGKRDAIAGTAPARVNTELGATRVRLYAAAFAPDSILQLDGKERLPEAPGAAKVVGWFFWRASNRDRRTNTSNSR
jgi:hypothetical protein